jgi:hypothetical protein
MGLRHVIGALTNGSLIGWGDGTFGAFGFSPFVTPTPVTFAPSFDARALVAAVAGDEYSLLISSALHPPLLTCLASNQTFVVGTDLSGTDFSLSLGAATYFGPTPIPLPSGRKVSVDARGRLVVVAQGAPLIVFLTGKLMILALQAISPRRGASPALHVPSGRTPPTRARLLVRIALTARRRCLWGL